MSLRQSINRFILLSLALSGLSVSSVNAAITSADSSFGVDTVTIDDSGLEWLDVTVTKGLSFFEVENLMDPGETYDGWRFATTAEVEGLFISAGAPDPFTNGIQGTDVQWIADLLDLWGTTTSGGTFHPGNEAFTDTGNIISSVTASLAIDVPGGTNDFASTTFQSISKSTKRDNLGSALVKVVPIPAAVWLFASALVGLIGFGKRRAKIAA